MISDYLLKGRRCPFVSIGRSRVMKQFWRGICHLYKTEKVIGITG